MMNAICPQPADLLLSEKATHMGMTAAAAQVKAEKWRSVTWSQALITEFLSPLFSAG